MQGFNFQHPIQVRWNDMDALGHVNNAVYVSYFEIARGAFINKAIPQWDWTRNIFLIANVNVDYHKELLLTAENPKVYVRTSKIGGKSFTLEFVLTSEESGHEIIHASGSSVQIMFDPQIRQTTQIPDWIRESFTSFDAVPA